MENPFAPAATSNAPAEASPPVSAFAPPIPAPAAPETPETPAVGPALSKGQLVSQTTEDPWKGKTTKAGIVLYAYEQDGRNYAVIGWLETGDSVDTSELSAV